MLRRVGFEELVRGDLVVVRWCDASELRGRLELHERPDVFVKDWGVFLGVVGARKRYVVVGKDVVELWNEWGAARIPVELVSEVLLVLGRDEVAKCVGEVQGLTRRVKLRKYRR